MKLKVILFILIILFLYLIDYYYINNLFFAYSNIELMFKFIIMIGIGITIIYPKAFTSNNITSSINISNKKKINILKKQNYRCFMCYKQLNFNNIFIKRKYKKKKKKEYILCNECNIKHDLINLFN